ncbi:MAG: alpha/beta fold hydrolase [Rubrivivax sp.]|nr:alpha/beta fold hydrolase [Rubrivivax sp.]
MSSVVQRAFVDVGGRQVHLRHAGEGPPVVLLHQSPASSAELEPLIRHLAPHFTVLAPDTPGFGHSDPLAPSDAEPGIDAFVDALLALFDVLGLQQPALFGSHTGAIVATRFAVRHPHRVRALVPNGVLLNTAADRADLLANYFPRFVPDWAGTHLAWLWSRLRDQLVYYPWYRRAAEVRIEWPMTLQEIEAAAADLLNAGDNYRGAYRAVLDYDIAPDLAALRVPTALLVAQTDALSMYVPQYPPPSEWLSHGTPADTPALYDAVSQFLQRHAGEPVKLSWPAGRLAGLSSRMVMAAGGQWHVRGQAAGAGRPLLVLHDLGSSARALDGLLGGLAGTRPLWAPDLPGHGLSDDFEGHTPEAVATQLLALLEALGVNGFDLLAEGASAAIALALAARGPGTRVRLMNPRALARDALPTLPAHLPPDLRADNAGSHLFRAWGWLKDRGLYSPWCERTAACALRGLSPPRPAQLQRGLIDLLRARPVFAAQFEAALSAATWDVIAASGATVLALAGHPAHAALAGVQTLPPEASGQSGVLRGQFG